MTRSLPPSTGIWAPVVQAKPGPHRSATSEATTDEDTSVPNTLRVRYWAGVRP